MIELLIKYIQDKGYQVEVRPPIPIEGMNYIFPGSLHIRKEAKNQIFTTAWAIPKEDLHPDFEEYLYYQATKKCDEIEKAIATYDAQPQ